MNPVLARLIEQRNEQLTFIDTLLTQVATDNRDLVDAERANLDSARERIGQLDAQIKPLEEFEKIRGEHRAVNPMQPTGQTQPAPLTVKAREQKYRSAGHFLTDYVRSIGAHTQNGAPDADAGQRVAAALGRAAGDVAPGVHQTTEDTPGLLPELIVGEILNDLDASRPFVQSVGVKDLTDIPGKVFHRPHVTQHTLVDEQTQEKAELASRELKIEGIPFTKRTFGGWLNVSRQDIDFTSPSAWNAILTDLQLSYGVDTEDTAAAAFSAAVTQTVPVDGGGATVESWIEALYEAAVEVATANGTKRASSLRLANTIWTSVDMWAKLGAILSVHRVKSVNSAGDSEVTGFTGDILDVPRIMVPGLPAGTMIVGRKELFEFYEQRLGILQAIVPKVLGVEVAYGGYAAFGALDPTGFAKITSA